MTAWCSSTGIVIFSLSQYPLFNRWEKCLAVHGCFAIETFCEQRCSWSTCSIYIFELTLGQAIFFLWDLSYIVGYWVAPWPLSTKDQCYSSPAWQPILPPDIAKDSWLSSQTENCGPMEIHLFNQLFFGDKVSYHQDWPWICYIVEDDIVLLILLPPTSKCWNYMYMTLSPIYMVMGTELRIV